MYHNSALTAIESGYLKRYRYDLAVDQNVINIVLISTVSDYAYLPFIIVAGNSVTLVGIIGNLVENVISTSGVTAKTLIGSNVDVKAIKESGKIRIKCTCTGDQLPVSIISLRSEGYIDTVSGAIS